MIPDGELWTNPARELARRQMERVAAITSVHLVIVSTRERFHVVEFGPADCGRMLAATIPALVRSTGASSAIVTSPAENHGRAGAIVALMERTLETFYVPIVRIVNTDTLIGDFRSTSAFDRNRYGPILEALIGNRIARDGR